MKKLTRGHFWRWQIMISSILVSPTWHIEMICLGLLNLWDAECWYNLLKLINAHGLVEIVINYFCYVSIPCLLRRITEVKTTSLLFSFSLRELFMICSSNCNLINLCPNQLLKLLSKYIYVLCFNNYFHFRLIPKIGLIIS